MTNPDTVTAIVEAAKEVFSQKGYHSTGVLDITSSIRMAKGTFYNYFKSKRALFDHVLRDLIGELVRRIESVSIDEIVDKKSYEAVGLKLASSVVQFFVEDKVLARIFFWESVGLDPASDELLDETYQRITGYTANYIRRGQSLGFVRDDVTAKVVATAMVGMCSHMLNRFLMDDFSDFTPEELVNTVVQIHLNGIFV